MRPLPALSLKTAGFLLTGALIGAVTGISATAEGPGASEPVQGRYCYTMGDQETPARAKRAAEARAREQAVANHRVYVQSASTVKNFQLEDDLIQTVSAGLLSDVRTAFEEKGREICASVTAQISPVKLDELIRQQTKAKDVAQAAQAPLVAGASFGLRLWTNKPEGRFVEGDPLIVSVQSERDGYLKLDYYQADGTVVHLVPNPHRGEMYVRAGQPYVFGEGSSESFTVTGPFGAETIKAFVSTARIDDPVTASRMTEDSRQYLQDLKNGSRGVRINPGAGAAQWGEAAISLTTASRAVTQYAMTRGLTRGGSRASDGATAAPNADSVIMQIFYATDRRATGKPQPVEFYGADRGALELGICDVSIPKDHRLGELESPSIWKLEFREDPKKHVILLRVVPQPAETFFTALQQRVGRSARREAFVFVHGYNVPFAEAARRTAQIAYDLKFPGAPILYSWPSQGRLSDYPVDETNVEWTVPHLKDFLGQLTAKSGAQTINLIAHSMGNRALTRALEKLALTEGGAGKPRFNEVVLTAPDIDAEVFASLAQEISKTARRVTMYGSSKDEALTASKKFHGYRRAGDTEVITVVPGVDTIDASTIDTSLIGHSYYGDNSSVIADLKSLLLHGRPPEGRSFLKPSENSGRRYWIFRP